LINALSGFGAREGRQDATHRELEPVLGNARQGSIEQRTDQQHKECGRKRPNACRQEQAPAGTDRDDDAHDLQTFEDDSLERHHCGEPLQIGPCLLGDFTEVGWFLWECELIIMRRNHPRGTQSGLAQPVQAEEEQHDADHQLQKVHGDAVEHGTEHRHVECQDGKPCHRAGNGRTTAAGGGNVEHNGEGFDHFHERARKAAVTAGATVAQPIMWS
jgi:hypothetical protein